MNLLEHFIKEVHMVETVTRDWGSFVVADLTVDCYGRVERMKESFPTMEAFNEAVNKGYFMA